MVATRRGVRVSYTDKTNLEQPADVQATPSTSQRTRRTAKHEDTHTQCVLVETCSQLEATPSSRKRCTRASRLHSPEHPSTPVGSVREGDASDVESCCSAVSDNEPLLTRSRRRRQTRTANHEEGEISEVESCSSAVSASKPSRSSRRSTRRNVVLDTVQVMEEDVKEDQVSETELDGSSASEFQRVTRSQRKSARIRSSAKQLTEDSELSDADSCISGVSGTSAPTSTRRRATRSRRQTCLSPVPLDKMSEGSQSPVPTGRRTRSARGKTAATGDMSEPPSCDSEGFESGPSYSVATWKMGKSAAPKEVDSGSETADVHSPVGSPYSTRSRGTPCSSRTGSGNSGRRGPVTRRSIRDCSVVIETAVEDASLNDSRLESTVIAEDADCTLLEEDESQTAPEQDDLSLTPNQTDTQEHEEEVCVISENVVSEAAVTEPAVTTQDQQGETSAENIAEDITQMEMMQEAVPPSEPVIICEKAPEASAEDGEKQDVADVDVQPEASVDEAAAVEPEPCVEEKMEVSMLEADAPQVVDSSEDQGESIQVTSRPEHKIRVESESEQEPEDIVVQNKKVISLLISSDDEDEYDETEEKEGSEEEEEDVGQTVKTGESSTKSEATAASVEGLFMIDTRPGQEANELYYREGGEEEATTTKGAEQEEDEEFMDEEGDDDEDDDAHILFSSRDPHLKELSSRIDPGIRMKELGGLYISFDGSKSKPVSSSVQKLKEKKIQDEVMKKSVIGPDFEKKDSVPPYSESKQALKLKHRAERAKTTGNGWFDMKAPEVTPELKGDLQVVKMRGSLDPKRFYKKNDRDGFPKYFQVGTVVDTAADFYHSRVPKKERKRTMVEELLADAEFRHNNKKRYQKIVMEKAAQGAGKRNKKKNKFNKK